ncbi:DNA-binding transcriptional regulator YhcF, GntR family [Fontibacillus panacisegetis]|uniref:DNA-binding transcriptional regulator YhcF, GntR family n=1 Tax=Fontibacillus panacisegetis TaxID=670482 RepID=A0A1G7GS35_9BACL|nr:GntR family transcriptional regulator [Fontibacillus panacisegetis]SDE90843.1 DNA-binding transcriptional regulator YhcF, GntR family [Fontibacillus panacisegetis]
MKFSNDHPIYLQIKNDFYQRICNGNLRPGDKLPSVREMAIEVGVNPNTIQRTYTDMERDGVVEKRRGQRSFVTDDEEIINQLRSQMAEVEVNFFLNSMKQMGYTNEEIQQQITEVIKREGGS